MSKRQNVDVAALCSRLRDSGLLTGSLPRGEMQRFSFDLFQVPLSPAVDVARRLFVRVSGAHVRGLTILVLGAVSLAVWNLRALVKLAITPVALPTYVLFVLVAVGLLGSILTHEMAHALVATRFGLAPRKIKVVAYLGLIPAFVLRIPGIYLLPAAKRIAVWAAGVVASLGLAGFTALLALHAPIPLLWRQGCAQAAVANLCLSGLNLLPFLPTDGYFILATVLRQPNMRGRAWRELGSCVRHKKISHPGLLAYALICFVFVLLILGRNVFGIYRLAHYSMSCLLLGGAIASTVVLIRWRALTRGAGRPGKQ